MLKPMLASALFAGLIAGLFAAGLQQAFLVPLIQEAELYETGQLTHFAGVETPAGTEQAAAEAHDHEAAAEGEESDTVRALLNVLTRVLSTCGFALVLVAGFAVAERRGLVRIDTRIGLLIGLAGFAAIKLMPSLGLAPELPAMSAADLGDRQLWWLATALATLTGLALIAWGNTAARIAGVLVIAAPQLWGAPHPQQFEGVVPPELAALFAGRAIAVDALGWAVLGAVAGLVWARERPA